MGGADWWSEWLVDPACASSFLAVGGLTPMDLSFLLCISFISVQVFFFSQAYMTAPTFGRFTKLTFLFEASMLLVVVCPHTLFIFLGWDGLGLSSYLLIMFYVSPEAHSSGNLTVTVGRTGDICLLYLLIFALAMGGSMAEFHALNKAPLEVATIAAAAMFLASATKSPQIPIHSWLLAAMSAPTPISALVHSSTLVAAGVYLLHSLAEMGQTVTSPGGIGLVLAVVGLTGLSSALSGAAEVDVKKIIALSTLGHVSLMVALQVADLGNLLVAHLLLHSLFKAGAFTTAGYLMAAHKGYQDVRTLPQNSEAQPGASAVLGMVFFSLMAILWVASFLTKEKFIQQAVFNDMMGPLPLLAILAGAVFSFWYTANLAVSVMASKSLSAGASPRPSVGSISAPAGWLLASVACLGYSAHAFPGGGNVSLSLPHPGLSDLEGFVGGSVLASMASYWLWSSIYPLLPQKISSAGSFFIYASKLWGTPVTYWVSGVLLRSSTLSFDPSWGEYPLKGVSATLGEFNLATWRYLDSSNAAMRSIIPLLGALALLGLGDPLKTYH